VVIIEAELLPEKEEIHNKMSLLLKRVSPFSKVLIDNLEFHTKSKSHFGLLSSTYLIVQRFSLIELQVNYLRCPYDVQEKICSHFYKKWFNGWYVACIDYYHSDSYHIWEFWSTTIYFSNKWGVGGVNFPINSVSPNDPVIKVREYGMIVYFMEFPNPKHLIFSKLTKF